MINQLHKALFFAILLSINTIVSQTGPGGVGTVDGTSNLEYWIDANKNVTGAPVTNWLDLSGNAVGNTITGGPTLTTNSLNGQSVITFDGVDDHIVTNLSINAGVFPNLTVIALYVPRIDGSGGVWGEDDEGWDRFILDKGTNLNSMVSKGTGPELNITGIFPRLTPVITTVAYQEDVTNGSTVYANGKPQRTFTSNFAPEASNNLHIGDIGSTSGAYYFDGNIAELMVFGKSINLAERIIIENYLAAKYGLTLSNNDIYKKDASGFDFNVAGIGQANDGSKHTDSKGTGIIRINTPSALSNGDFLIWGEDKKNANYNFSTTSNYKQRLDTKWKVSKTNFTFSDVGVTGRVGLGNVTLIVDEADLDFSGKSPCKLQLIIDDNSNFSSIKRTYTFTKSGTSYIATDVNLENQDHFTLEYVDTIVLDNTTAFNGSGALNKPNTLDACYKLLVKNTVNGNLKLTENANVKEIEIESGGNLVVDSGFKLEVEDGIVNNGDIRLIGSSQLIQKHTGTSLNSGTGNLFKDQNSDLASVYRYNYWSSPVSSAVGSSSYTVAGVMKNGTLPTSVNSNPPNLNFTKNLDGNTTPLTISSNWIYGYVNGDGSGTGWSKKQESGTFNVGEGFLLKSPGAAQNYTFKGVPNDGDISFSIDAGHTSLLGNPYPSAIDANLLFTESSNIAALYFWEHKNELVGTGIEGHYKNGYIGGYGTRNATMGTAATTAVTGTAGLGNETYTAPKRYIPVGQGFFVEPASGLAATVNFKNSQRSFVTESGDSYFFKSKKTAKELYKNKITYLKVGFEAKDSKDIYLHSQIGISFKKGNTKNYDIGYDSRKYEINASDIYFNFSGIEDNLVIAGIGEIRKDLEIPIVVKNDSDAPVFLMIDEKQNINMPTFFKDAYTGVTYETNKPLKLKLAKGVYKNRFFITFSKETLGNTEILKEENLITVFKQEANKLVVQNTSLLKIKNIKVFNLLGASMLNYNTNNIANTKKIILNINKIPQGIYIISIKTAKGIINKKIIL
ncbi:T9SS type A sorting domain-containing protein [Polaribacter cellanae]|uniref:T9SS type A sorting domain-containing protein n=1 Tax=Polaribacter cellanae TaxID=2818493 RepID=A0A975H812_9FLAO|nr:T9SS type A sorting domain-containing protein [Polaribacter cellanae]QTE24032.1 T9SS type A sorting domain-containing protein [Polaribacter cellanae]